MPKVTDEHRRARKRQILTAAFTCFGREGFHGTTMEDICTEADLSPGAVYNYFDGKDDIIRAIAEESRGSHERLFEDVDGDTAAPEMLGDVMQRLGEFVDQPGDADEGGHGVRVRLWSEALDVTAVKEPFLQNMADIRDRFVEIIQEGQEKGTIRTDVDADGLARALLACHHGMVLQKALSPDDDVTPAFDAVNELLCSGSS